MLTQEILKMNLSYDPETGKFERLIGRFAGSSVGCVDTCGHKQIRIEGKIQMAHRLAWLYMTGSFPTQQIDHIDGNKANNRWNNLREVTNSENQQNRNAAKLGKNLLGVFYRKDNKKYRAMIRLNGTLIRLGQFNTEEEAHQAYLEAKQQYHLARN